MEEVWYLLYLDAYLYCKADTFEEAIIKSKGFCDIVRFTEKTSQQINFVKPNKNSLEYKEFILSYLLEQEKECEKKLLNLIRRRSKNTDKFRKEVAEPLWDEIQKVTDEIKEIKLKNKTYAESF